MTDDASANGPTASSKDQVAALGRFLTKRLACSGVAPPLTLVLLMPILERLAEDVETLHGRSPTCDPTGRGDARSPIRQTPGLREDSAAYAPLPIAFVRVIEAQRAAHIDRLRQELSVITCCSPLSYAMGFAVEILGDSAERLGYGRVCDVRARPDKYDGAWLLHGPGYERYIDHETLCAAFPK